MSGSGRAFKRVHQDFYGLGFRRQDQNGLRLNPKLLQRPEPALEGPGDLVSTYFIDGKVSITPVRNPFRVLISLLIPHLLSPPSK